MEKATILEELRHKLVYSMKLGSVFCLNLDNAQPDFRCEWTDNEVFPFDKICEFDEWREDDNYK